MQIAKKSANAGLPTAMPSGAYESSFVVNGGVLTPFGFESSTHTIVLQQLVALKTIESKFYVATSCVALIPALGMTSIIVTEVPYQTRVRIPVWDSLETHHSSRSGNL